MGQFRNAYGRKEDPSEVVVNAYPRAAAGRRDPAERLVEVRERISQLGALEPELGWMALRRWSRRSEPGIEILSDPSHDHGLGD